MGETISQIGRYEISRQLVDTALASVYDAFDPVERKPVAIRVPRTTQVHALNLLAVGLQHPGLMTVLSCEESQGAPFLVLEPFEGKPLDGQLPAGRMDPPEALALLRQLASALDYAHSHGSLHGSLHPCAILLNDRQEIKVLDLGSTDIAGLRASPEQLLRAVHFLSPECLRDQPMDGRSDQFSLAVLAHRMLTGELPFPGTALGVMFRIAYQGLESDAMRGLPPGARSVLRRSLAKSPMERYATCGEMVESLASSLIRLPMAATRVADAALFAPLPPAAARGPVDRPASGEGLKYFVITFLACAVILAAVFFFLLPKPVRPVPAPVVTVPVLVVPGITGPGSAPGAGNPPVPAPPAAVPVPVVEPPPVVVQAPKAKPAVKGRARKRAQPELELKPVEPRIIR